MNWNKQVHDFGETQPNLTVYTTFKYLGNLNISSSNFMVSCGCTSVIYNPDTKEASVGLNTGPIEGEKSTVVTVNFPDSSQDLLQLKATITK